MKRSFEDVIERESEREIPAGRQTDSQRNLQYSKTELELATYEIHNLSKVTLES